MYGEFNGTITFDLETLKYHSDFKAFYHKGDELDDMLLLNTNRKPYIRSPMTQLNLTFRDLEMSKSRSFRFQSPVSHKGAYLGYILVLNPYRMSFNCALICDLK